jgi:hypothetical protein
MLWMKAWPETRWRLLYTLAIPLAALALPHIIGGGATSQKAADKATHTFMGVMAFFSLFGAAYLAGAGIKSQSPFAAMKGLEGSMYYTLALPVSRLRLILVRAGVGLMEFGGVSAVVYSAFWLFSPARGSSTPFDLLKLILAAVASMACFYFIAVLLATFLDDPWPTFGGMFATIVVWFVISRISPPPSINLFGFAGDASPLITHTLPWPAMGISLIASAILLWVALKIAERRDY